MFAMSFTYHVAPGPGGLLWRGRMGAAAPHSQHLTRGPPPGAAPNCRCREHRAVVRIEGCPQTAGSAVATSNHVAAAVAQSGRHLTPVAVRQTARRRSHTMRRVGRFGSVCFTV